VQALAAELGDHVLPAVCDVTDQDQVDQLVARIDELDALVLTAGISGSMGVGRQNLLVNVVGTARVLRAFETVPGHGSVAVCFASMSGHRVPESPELDRVLDHPLSERLFDDLIALGLDRTHLSSPIPSPSAASSAWFGTVARIGGPGAPASWRCRRGSLR